MATETKEPPEPKPRPTDLPSIVTQALASYYLAGFSASKMRQLLQTIPGFAAVDSPQYAAAHIEQTARALQARDRQSEQGSAHVRLVMASASPFQLRAAANRAFADRFPAQERRIDERADLAEMRTWQARWREEARLLRGTPFWDFDDKARLIDKCLDDYERQLVPENVGVLERSLRKVSFSPGCGSLCPGRANVASKSESPSPKRGRVAAASVVGQPKPQLLPHPPPAAAPERPNLKLSTRGLSASRVEGTPTPGRAQRLDPEGFFSPRPGRRNPTP